MALCQSISLHIGQAERTKERTTDSAGTPAQGQAGRAHSRPQSLPSAGFFCQTSGAETGASWRMLLPGRLERWMPSHPGEAVVWLELTQPGGGAMLRGLS